MGRPLRRQEPGQFYSVTIRCHQARFFLRPSSKLNEVLLEWLARAQMHFPGVTILAVCVMSNHIHLVVRDTWGELDKWASYFFGHLARAVNRLRRRHGRFFERRYSAVEILDDESLVDRLVYVVTNPVAAHLCKRVEDWPGVVLFSTDGTQREIPVSWADRDAYRKACTRTQRSDEKAADSSGFQVQGKLLIDPLTPTDSSAGSPENINDAIEARENELAAQRRQEGRKVLGQKKVRAQSWHAAPRHPKRSPRPLCHAATSAVYQAFRDGVHEFVTLFREASERLRGGEANVTFPDWCFPPGQSLVRPASTGVVPGAG